MVNLLHVNKPRKNTRRPHHKSRYGCANCKKRKVKCNEEKPECANCVRFGVQCSFASGVAIRKGPPSSTSVRSEQSLSEIRGRGRPRNNWTATVEHDEISEASGTSWASATPSLYTAEEHIDQATPNVREAELLLHFVQSTAYTLAGSDKIDDPMVRFWTYNLPRIGLSHHFTLHLAYAVAGYHLAYLDKTEDRRQGLRILAELHASAGLAQLTATLARLDPTNCGAAYISATLVCYCTFAAGPTGPGDLLVCNVDQGRDHNWLPSIHGLRLIRESFDDDVLFAGLMDPFRHESYAQDKETTPAPDKRARFSREGFLRVDWEQPLSDLRGFIVMYDDGGGDDAGICLRSLDSLITIYRATYGDKDGSYDGPQEYQHAFGWMYRLEKGFVACLWRKDPRALIILAYFVLLFETMKGLWFLDNWERHLLTRVKYLLGEEYVHWLRWPLEIAGLA